jgi:pilus assembly protein FimV
MTDPDDIDALLDSVNNSLDAETVNNSADIDVQPEVEMTDPDDIDALLDSVNNSLDAETVNNSADIDVQPEAEMTDPDDIDALLDSINDDTVSNSNVNNSPVSSADKINNSKESNEVNNTETQQNNEQPTSDSGITSSNQSNVVSLAEDLKIQQEINDNQAKIAEFTAEYVTPFLTADFSDVVARTEEQGLNESQEKLTEKKQALIANSDLDIDALLDSIQPEELQEDKSLVEQAREALGDDLITSVESQATEQGFSTDDLNQLLTEQPSGDEFLSLAPELKQSSADTTDFTNEEVLAELLNDNNTEDKAFVNDDALESIGDLDNVDFDDLLADIEQESANYEQDGIDNNSVFTDMGDDLISEEQHKGSILPLNPVGQDYVSVDELLNDSLSDNTQTEPYQKENIDVGLGQFSTNKSAIDVDIDGSMSAKLDLAKMYIEISDEENAEVILQEVLLSGDNTQQVKAKRLLDTLKT